MKPKQRKRLILATIAIVVLGAILYGFLPEPVEVEVAVVDKSPMQVIVEEEGETRVANSYVVSSPVAAFAQRIDLEEGDFVEKGQVLVRLEPPRPVILDPRTRAEAVARVEAAEAALQQAEEQAEAAAAVARQASDEQERIQRLHEAGSATEQAVEQAVAQAQQANASLNAARAAVATVRAELAAARAVLQYESTGINERTFQEALRAPVSGRILKIHRKSEGMVNPGEPLIEIGDTSDLEVHVDVLSQDAVKITPGTRVLLGEWGGETDLEASVKRVEPMAFTSVSSLGVEEQRVTVVAGITSEPDKWERLGAGYRILARFVLWEEDSVLQVPNSALFRTDEGWSLFAIEDDIAVPRQVTVGHQSGLYAQILSGVEEGEEVIAQPERTIEAGTKVTPR